MTGSYTLFDECDSVSNYITAAREIIQSGTMPDLATLTGRIAALCSVLEKTEGEVRKEFGAKLQAIQENLNACEKEMTALHARLTLEQGNI